MRHALAQVIGIVLGAVAAVGVVAVLPMPVRPLAALGAVLAITAVCVVGLVRVWRRARRRAQEQRLADEIEQYLADRTVTDIRKDLGRARNGPRGGLRKAANGHG